MARVDSPSTRAVKPSTDARKRYTSSHWGEEATAAYEWADVPDHLKLTEMGKMVEITYIFDDTPDGEEPEDVGVIAGFQSPTAKEPDILAFSPQLDERLYIALSGRTKEWSRRNLRVRRAQQFWIQDVADDVGGRQARFPFHAAFKVQRIGPVYSIAYRTLKTDDGPKPSTYEHTQGEWGGVRPELCVDEFGGLWLAGGSYTVPDEGITR